MCCGGSVTFPELELFHCSERNAIVNINGGAISYFSCKCLTTLIWDCVQIKSSYFLVSIVDNDYVNGDLFSLFASL